MKEVFKKIFTIHFATINTSHCLYNAAIYFHLQYTLLLLIQLKEEIKGGSE